MNNFDDDTMTSDTLCMTEYFKKIEDHEDLYDVYIETMLIFKGSPDVIFKEDPKYPGQLTAHALYNRNRYMATNKDISNICRYYMIHPEKRPTSVTTLPTLNQFY